MTKHERIIMKYYKRLSTDEVCTETLVETDIPLTFNEINLCLAYMNEKGLFKEFHKDIAENITFQLNYNALHRKEILFEKIMDFIITSVFVPIAVSVLTTFILWVMNL